MCVRTYVCTVSSTTVAELSELTDTHIHTHTHTHTSSLMPHPPSPGDSLSGRRLHVPPPSPTQQPGLPRGTEVCPCSPGEEVGPSVHSTAGLPCTNRRWQSEGEGLLHTYHRPWQQGSKQSQLAATVLLNTLHVLPNTLPVLLNTLHVLLNTLPVLLNTLHVLLNTLHVLLNTLPACLCCGCSEQGKYSTPIFFLFPFPPPLPLSRPSSPPPPS